MNNSPDASDVFLRLEEIRRQYEALREGLDLEKLDVDAHAVLAAFEQKLQHIQSYLKEYPLNFSDPVIDDLIANPEDQEMVSRLLYEELTGYPPWEENDANLIPKDENLPLWFEPEEQSLPEPHPWSVQEARKSPAMHSKNAFGILRNPANLSAARSISQAVIERLHPKEITAGILDILLEAAAIGKYANYQIGEVAGGFGGGAFFAVIVVPVVAFTFDQLFQQLHVETIDQLKEQLSRNRNLKKQIHVSLADLKDFLGTIQYQGSPREVQALVDAVNKALVDYLR